MFNWNINLWQALIEYLLGDQKSQIIVAELGPDGLLYPP